MWLCRPAKCREDPVDERNVAWVSGVEDRRQPTWPHLVAHCPAELELDANSVLS